jgi:hypothetical protein
METQIEVNAKGKRPIQTEMMALEGQHAFNTLPSIAPECNFSCRITAWDTGNTETGQNKREGQGTVTVRVYGHSRADFFVPPIVKVRHVKNGKTMGQTKVEAHPVPEKPKAN